MEIVKPGKKPEDKQHEWSCKNCKAVIRATWGEGRFQSDQRDGDAIIYNCPECKAENWVAVSLFR